jgi:hypothetical protein
MVLSSRPSITIVLTPLAITIIESVMRSMFSTSADFAPSVVALVVGRSMFSTNADFAPSVVALVVGQSIVKVVLMGGLAVVVVVVIMTGNRDLLHHNFGCRNLIIETFKRQSDIQMAWTHAHANRYSPMMGTVLVLTHAVHHNQHSDSPTPWP